MFDMRVTVSCSISRTKQEEPREAGLVHPLGRIPLHKTRPSLHLPAHHSHHVLTPPTLLSMRGKPQTIVIVRSYTVMPPAGLPSWARLHVMPALLYARAW